jgi:hypothetical protein
MRNIGLVLFDWQGLEYSGEKEEKNYFLTSNYPHELPQKKSCKAKNNFSKFCYLNLVEHKKCSEMCV